MIIIITVMTFITMFLVVYLVLNVYLAGQKDVRMRLKSLEYFSAGSAGLLDEELAQPFIYRVLFPLRQDLASALARLTPRSIRTKVEARLLMAGGFGDLGAEEFLLLCGFLGLTLPAVTIFLLSYSQMPFYKILLLGGIAGALGIVLPFLLLSHKIKARKASMQRDLPDVLDLLTVSVEAGLGFDGALAKLAEKMKGALVEEFNRVLQEIRIGVARRDALHAMGQRCNVPDLSLFTTSLVQADQLGVSIGNVLRVQSAGMREKRRQRAEEKAMKAPIKMMIPMVLFIFPTIFIVLLGPAVIQIFNAFGHM